MLLRKSPILALLLMMVVVATGCSRAKLFYSQLEWTLPIYVNTYVTLDDAQRMRLRAHVNALLDWHCGVHLHKYAAWFRRAARDVEAARLDGQALRNFSKELESFWREVMEQAAPRIADLLYNASDAQVEELFRTLSAKNHDMQVELVDAPPNDIEEALTQKIEVRLERWLGSITPAQHKSIVRWHSQVGTWQAERLAMRKRWQRALRKALDQRDDPTEYYTRVTSLLRHPERVWSATYRTYAETYRTGVLTLLEEILATLTPEQRDHLTRRLIDWADDLQGLACGPEVRPASHLSAPTPGQRVAGQGRGLRLFAIR